MQDGKFYGTEKISSLSYLEFGAIDLNLSKKLVWDLKLHQKAYDWYMHGRYSNDIVCYLDLNEQVGKMSAQEMVRLYMDEVHHKDDFSVNIGKLCALAVARNGASPQKALSFFELGQTLFGCIDTMEFCQKLAIHLKAGIDPVNFRDVEWYGVDISDFFNKMSILMHSGYRVQAFNDMKYLDSVKDVFFAKGVTVLYAVRSISQLMALLNSAKICVFDYSFAANAEHDVIIGSGKLVKYLKMKDFLSKAKDLPGSFYVKKGNSFYDRKTDRVVVDCLYADEKVCQEFMALDRSIRNVFSAYLAKEKDAEVFLDNADGKNSGWMRLEEFVKLEVKA